MLIKDKSKNSPFVFFILTLLLSIPFYILNALANENIVGEPKMSPLYIAMFTLTPMLSAIILTIRSEGTNGIKKLLARIFDFKRINKFRWVVTSIFLPPLIFLFSIGILILSSLSIPSALTSFLALPAVFLFFFILAAAEEVGWMGYAYEAMQKQKSAFISAIVLGIIWALWHIPFFIYIMPDPFVFTSQIVMLIGIRVLIAWIFNNAGNSVFTVILYHASDNTALVTLPEIKAIIPWGSVVLCITVLLTATIVILLWGGRMLNLYRFGSKFHRI